MNAIFKTIWNRARKQWVVVHERTNAALQGRSSEKSSRARTTSPKPLRLAALAVAVSAVFGMSSVQATTLGGLKFTDTVPHKFADNHTSDLTTWGGHGLENYYIKADKYVLWKSLAALGQGVLSGSNITLVGGSEVGGFVFDRLATSSYGNATINVAGLRILGDEGRAVNYGAYNGGTLVIQDAVEVTGGSGTGGEANLAYGIAVLSEGSNSQATINVETIRGNVADGIYAFSNAGGTSRLRVGNIFGGKSQGVSFGANAAGSRLYVDAYRDGQPIVIQGGERHGFGSLAREGGTTVFNESGADGFVMSVSSTGEKSYGINIGAMDDGSVLRFNNVQLDVTGGNSLNSAGFAFMAARGGKTYFDGTINATGTKGLGIHAGAFEGGYVELNLRGGTLAGSATTANANGFQYVAHGEGSSATIAFDGTTLTGGGANRASGLYVMATEGATVNASGGFTATGGSADFADGIANGATNGGELHYTVRSGDVVRLVGGAAKDCAGWRTLASTNSTADITVEAGGELVLSSGASNSTGMAHIASSGGTGTITVNGALSFNVEASGYGLFAVAYEEESEGKLILNSNSDLLGGQDGFAVYLTAADGGNGTITNNATMRIGSGGVGALSRGDGSIGTIINNSELVIGESDGIAVNFLALLGGEGIIRNSDGGTLTIGSKEGASSSAIVALAISQDSDVSTSQASIINEGSGTIEIVGRTDSGAIRDLACGAKTQALLTNAGSGELIIRGADGTGDKVTGIESNAYDGGIGTISNTGEGSLTIVGGGKSHAAGLYRNAWGTGSIGTILNSGKGSLVISGGSDSSGYGIAFNASQGTGTISNSGEGSLTITGGSGGGYGILGNSYFGTGIIANSTGGTLNILGDETSGGYGIGYLTYGEGSVARLENAGIMNLNKNAIETFGTGDVLVTNRATGTINAEAEAIFQTGASEVTYDDIAVSIFTDGRGVHSETIDNYATEITTTKEWTLKDDWANHSVWEDGGKLVITDMNGSCGAAQEIKAAFEKKFGTGTTVSFIGTENVAGSGGQTVVGERPAFTVSHLQDMIKSGQLGDGDVLIGERLISANLAKIPTRANQSNLRPWGYSGILHLHDTGSESDPGISAQMRWEVEQSVGFKALTDEGPSAGAPDWVGVFVEGDKQLTLVGDAKEELALTAGAPVVLSDGNFRMGLKADGLAETKGSVTTVTMSGDSTVRAENGWFNADSVTGSGNLSVDGTGRLHVKNVEITGKISNAGMLSADALKVSGTLESSKVLKSSGTISVDAGSKLLANGIVAADSLDVKGAVLFGKDAQVYLGAAAMEAMRKAHADVAADLDRLEGKAEFSTMSVLDRLVAESMKKTSEKTVSNRAKAETPVSAAAEDKPDTSKSLADKDQTLLSSMSDTPDITLEAPQFSFQHRVNPGLPQDAQAFAAFDAVNRIASDIDAGGTPVANGLWVKVLTDKSEFGVRSGSKFEVESEGAVVGAEAKIAPSLKIGAAFSYLDGEIDAGVLKSDWKSYGLASYAHYSVGDFGVKGTLGWLRGTTRAAEDLDADVLHAGVRAEYDVLRGPITVTPFLGARLMDGSFDGEASQTVVSVPLGVKLAGEVSTSGWTVVPALEASYVRSMGDTETEDIRFLPENTFTGALSLKAAKDAWTGELSFRGATGSSDYEDRSLTAKVGIKF